MNNKLHIQCLYSKSIIVNKIVDETAETNDPGKK